MLIQENESWRDVRGYEGLYEVSDLGRIKSLKRKGRKNDRILKSTPNRNGYLTLGLYKDGKAKLRTIHQLVAESFLNHTPNGNKGLNVDHIKNDQRTNNRLDNLQLLTHIDNLDKDRKTGTSEFRGVCWSKRNNRWKAQIRINGKQKYLGIFTDELEASQAYQIALETVNLAESITTSLNNLKAA